MSSPGSSTPPNQQFSLDNKMMVAAIIVMFLVLVFIFSLHVYAKWFFRRSATRSRTTSLRRRRFDFAGHDPFIVTGSVGLDKAVLDSLPAFVYQAPPADEAVLECAVCLCEFEDKENGRLLPKCNHSFHKDCIDMWFFSHSTCPLCRTVVTAESFPAAQHEQAQASASSSPLSEVLDQLRSGMQTSEAANSTGSLLPTTEGYILSRDDVLFPSSWGIPYPLTSLFGSDDNQRSSLLSSQSPDRPHAGSVPQITIDVQRRADILNSSLTSPRCLSADEQACSSPGGQPLKSPTSFRNSIRRLLSRESRVFPSDRAGGESEQEAFVSPV